MRTSILLAALVMVSGLAWSQAPPMIQIQDTGLEGKPAPSVKLDKLGGGSVELKEFKGKVVIVSFWASWCGPCRQEMPELDKIYKEMASKGVMVVGINVDRESAEASKWLQSNPVSFPIALDPDSRMLGAYGVESMPTSFVVDRSGVVKKKTVGFRVEDIEQLKSLVKSL